MTTQFYTHLVERRGEERRGEEWRGEERRGEERSGVERRGEEWRGEIIIKDGRHILVQRIKKNKNISIMLIINLCQDLQF